MSIDAWIDGELVPAHEARVPLLSHALHYGTAVFEGARVYATPRGPALFRYAEHLDRLFRSAELYKLRIPYSHDEIWEATREVISRSGLSECYVRPIVFPAEGTMGVSPRGARVSVAIAIWEWGPYLGEEAKRSGVATAVSSWARLSSAGVLPFAKAAGHYVNAALAKLEAEDSGYDEAIMLDARGFVSEGPGDNVFLVKAGRLATPGLTSSILDGITRRSVIEIAADIGLETEERDVSRQELYVADEVFLTGTAVELTPVREVDRHPPLHQCPGPVTRQIQQLLDDALHGRSERYAAWSVPVSEASASLDTPAKA